ncbi:hypothetical protein DGMP_22570 [Desulfomarina profundi]|uniref:Uncharacterized protein n=1 Tax=Desulfomarina profundi TaxID=2772557 RepID=A0A8D5JHK5_9BACT|nr:hypothetical protein [Desulfomarina profundi]BCL61564.1 hypothetical protein DGMP_22570 [Desulfomarina profundi]
MKLKIIPFLFLPVLFLCLVSSLFAGDMRKLDIQAREIKEKMILQAAKEKRLAERIALENQAKILKDRTALRKAVTRLKDQNRYLKQKIDNLTARQVELDREEKQLSRKLNETSGVMRELVGPSASAAGILTRSWPGVMHLHLVIKNISTRQIHRQRQKASPAWMISAPWQRLFLPSLRPVAKSLGIRGR